MSVDGEERRLDDKGRLVIPQQIRKQLNLEPGERVRVAVEDGTVVVRPQISRKAFIDSMHGCISEESKADDAPSIDPEDLKADWTADLPDNS